MGRCKLNPSYILDNLIKHQCEACGKQFIVSEHSKKQLEMPLMCPYCGCVASLEIAMIDDHDKLEELGCMAIGHYEE